jgi:hypothetical protein
MAGTVTGGRETLAHLRQLDKDLYWRTVNRMKAAAQPLADGVVASFPTDPPMSGFDHKGRTGWNRPKVTKTKVGGRRNRRGWPLVRIFVADAPRMIFDLATGKLGEQLEAHGYGSPSRAVWRTAASLRDDTTDAVEKVIRDVARETNRKLARVG